MKRALAMALGAVMVAGSAAPATAASHIDFSGYYRVMYMSETNTGYGSESRSFTDSYFQDRLQLDLTFSPTDEISIYWRLRGPGTYQRWGRYTKADKNLYTQFIYGEIKQDWGTVLVGRMSDDLDCAGLCAFGYMPATVPVFTNVGPFDRADIMDGVRYSYDWDNGLSVLAQYVKLGNNGVQGDTNDNWDSDQDYDRIQAQVAYAWDGGGVVLHGFYDRNAQGNGKGDSFGWGRKGGYGAWTNEYYGRDYYGLPWGEKTVYPAGDADNRAGRDGGRLTRLNKIEQWGLNPGIMHSWGDFSVHFEGMATWGTAQYIVRNRDTNRWDSTYDQDGEGYGAYLDFDYNYGPGNVTLGAWWVSGTDLNENPDDLHAKNKSLADIVGGNFYPLLVAYNGVNSNPAGNRYYGNAGNHVSAIGFANNAYENYVYEGHLGGVDIVRNAAGVVTDLSYTALNSNIAGNAVELNPFVSGTWDGDLVEQVLYGGNGNRTRTTSFNNDTDANHWAIALTGNHAFTDDITMHYGLAYLALNKPNYRVANSASYSAIDGYHNLGYTTQDKDLGFEIDLGFTFQLLDNLKFTSAFGYMFNGDAYKQFKGYKVNQISANAGNTVISDGDSIRGVWGDADDSYVWFNSLTFAF